MSNYYVRRTGDDSDYLAHANMMATDSGGRKHKYITKINIGGKVRYIYDPRYLAKQAGGVIGGAISNVRRTAGSAIRNAPGNVSRFIDRNITGASAQRSYKAQKKLYDKYSSMGSAKARDYATSAKRAAQNSQKRYNRSLAGRLASAGGRIANVGNKARNFVGQQASRARQAGSSFAGSISSQAYKVAGAADKAIGISARKKAKQDRLSAEAYEKSYGATRRYGRASESTMAKMYRKKRQKANQAATSENIYNRSLLGRAESALDSASDFLKKKKRKKQAKANLARNNTTSLRANVKKSAAEKSKKIKGMQQTRRLKNAHTRNRHYMV